MANRENKNLITDESIEDVTQFGEFISSFDQWTTFDNQSRIVNHLQNCTSPDYNKKYRWSARK